MTVIDTNRLTTPHIPQLQAAQVETVIRYINPLFAAGEKTVKPAEAKALAAAGIKLGLVCESWGDFAHGAISAAAGERDGHFCAAYARVVGAPDDACVFFAVDTDASQAQITKLVLPYFASIVKAFAGSGLVVGVYGSGDVCRAVMAAGGVAYAWLSCSTGWGGSHQYLADKSKELVLVQHLPHAVGGIDADSNDKLGEFGDFIPTYGAPVQPQPLHPLAEQVKASLAAGAALPSTPTLNALLAELSALLGKPAPT